MGYTTRDCMVRVDVWKQHGKWYDSLELNWDRYFTKGPDGYETIHDTFARCIYEQYPGLYQGMWATCLHPHHEHEHPLMYRIPEE